MARSDRTIAKQLLESGSGQLMPNLLLRIPLKILLLLASVSIAQAAAAQPVPPAETAVGETAIIPAPKNTTTMAAAENAARYRQATQTAGSTVSTSPLSTPSAASISWPVATSLKSTLRAWAQRQGWPAPQFLTEADWAVDVPGSISGSIEDALKALAEGFGQSPTRPRIAVTGNHVILVSEVGAE
jgi:hypothetical protein